MCCSVHFLDVEMKGGFKRRGCHTFAWKAAGLNCEPLFLSSKGPSNQHCFGFDFPCKRKGLVFCFVLFCFLRATVHSQKAWGRLEGRLMCDILIWGLRRIAFFFINPFILSIVSIDMDLSLVII